MKRDIIITGEKVHLSNFIFTDLDYLYKAKNDIAINKFVGNIKKYTFNDIYEYYETCKEILTIIELGLGEIIGFVGLKSVCKIHNKGTMFIYMCSTKYTGKGYGTEALKLFLNYCFGKLGLHKLKLNVHSDNLLAIDLYQRLGFKRCGLFKDEIFKFGKYVNLIWMEILEDEYRSLHKD